MSRVFFTMGINGQQAGNITLELFDEVSRGASKNFQLSRGGTIYGLIIGRRSGY